ncbi:hypothetical protein OG896_16460 [Streptomyces sp. NBC_00669]|uniref:hypothetical protein n=1 Tax=Streptomyces sp. NBC_00669 TaxID=2976011 RepID=UPI002E32B2BC|nr:hypothetical protein [Streptomyces sp. NBC_00669]
MSDELLRTVVKAMAQMISAIDMTTDDEVDPDLATTWFEDVAAQFDGLSDEDRRGLAQLFRQVAAGETQLRLREAMMSIPESFGLEDDEDA